MRDPAEFHDLAVAGRDMFRPVAALPGRPLRAAVLDDWSAPQIANDPVTAGLWPDVGPVRKLAAEMTALTLTDAGRGVRRGKGSAPMHSPDTARYAAPLRSVFAGTSFGPPRRRLISTITGRLVTAEDDAALFTAGALTDLTPFLAAASAGAVSCGGAGNPARSVT
ncbi:MAG: hypothetical protein ACRDOC_14335 [Streptosporangiaceae bacterium]